MPKLGCRLIYSEVKQIEVRNKTELKSEIKSTKVIYQDKYKSEMVYVDSEIINY